MRRIVTLAVSVIADESNEDINRIISDALDLIPPTSLEVASVDIVDEINLED